MDLVFLGFEGEKALEKGEMWRVEEIMRKIERICYKIVDFLEAKM